MRVAALLAWVLAFTGCVQPITHRPTPALMFRFEEGAFRHCQIMLNWTPEELEQSCGKPLMDYPSANSKQERCVLYDSLAVGLAVSTSKASPYFVVCIGPVEESAGWDSSQGKTAGTRRIVKDRVTGVFGVKAVPAK